MSISLRELAKLCDLSISTVSKALNDYADVNPNTKAFVLKTAREVGYFPNAAARTLKTGRTLNLGILYAFHGMRVLTHYYFIELLDSFKVEAERHGYDITFINHNIGNQAISYREHCLYRNMDGVCIMGANYKSPEIQELVQSDIITVTIDRECEGCSCVMSENRMGVRKLVERAYEMGHRRIAFINGYSSYVADPRGESYRDTLRTLGLTVREEYMGEAFYQSPNDTQVIAAQMLTLPEPPTCLLTPDDFSALGAIEAVRAAGLRMPEDVSVIGYDGTNVFQKFTPQLTTYRQDAERIGITAAQKLIEHIENPDTPCETIVIEGQFLPGKTLARRSVEI